MYNKIIWKLDRIIESIRARNENISSTELFSNKTISNIAFHMMKNVHFHSGIDHRRLRFVVSTAQKIASLPIRVDFERKRIKDYFPQRSALRSSKYYDKAWIAFELKARK